MGSVVFVAMLALIEYAVFTGLVGWARVRLGVEAPAVTGHPEFERYLRVQQNTLEQLIVFLPALLAFARFVSIGGAVLLGVAFIAGRALYFRSYITDPSRRTAGFLIGSLANAVLLLGGAGGALLAALR